jgi:hypothetical protein
MKKASTKSPARASKRAPALARKRTARAIAKSPAPLLVALSRVKGDQLVELAFMGASILAGAARELEQIAEGHSGDDNDTGRCIYNLFNHNIGLRSFLGMANDLRPRSYDSPAGAAEAAD